MQQLSVCIPVFNTEVKPLVTALLRMDAPFLTEILLFDDGSEFSIKKQNAQLGELEKVVYQEMPENFGRSKIRNTLGKAAKGDYLLFIDDDCIPEKDDFLSKYTAVFNQAEVLCGGHTYPTKVEKSSALHHFIGSQSEVQPAEEKNKKPFASFHSSNFCISKPVFLQVLFNEQLTQYGHEDTLFGYELQQADVTLLHVENPVLHLGVQTNVVFIEKTEKALQNLAYLYKNQSFDFVKNVKLLAAYSKLEKVKATLLLKRYYSLCGAKLRKKLINNKPNVGRYNRYKIAYLCWLLR